VRSCGAAAVICFEWLQRPENVIAGHIKWSGYRPSGKPTIQIEHHKTGAVIEHPLEEKLEDCSIVKFYEEAEEILSHLKRRGVPMILREAEEGKSKPYPFSGMQKIVQRMRKDIGLPVEFTLDACRHGGMTELEEAELTEGQGRALLAHRTKESYAGYAKRTSPGCSRRPGNATPIGWRTKRQHLVRMRVRNPFRMKNRKMRKVPEPQA
jgi:hypothetical protein